MRPPKREEKEKSTCALDRSDILLPQEKAYAFGREGAKG